MMIEADEGRILENVLNMLELGPLARPHYDSWRHIVLVSSDTDFVPAIRLLSAMGVHTIVIGFDSKEHPYPIELKNESYLFLEWVKCLRKWRRSKIETHVSSKRQDPARATSQGIVCFAGLKSE